MSEVKDKICIVAGMPRTATTSLFYILKDHPDVFMPYRKETDYFAVNYDKGEEWYLDLFKEIEDEKTAMDMSPNYFIEKESVNRIKNFNKDVKIIMGVREPADWSVSLYKHFVKLNNVKVSFEDFCEAFDFYTHLKYIHFELKDQYVINMLDEFRETFKDNILLIDFSFFKKEPLKVIQAIENFLGIKKHFNEGNFENKFVNSSSRNSFISFIVSLKLVRKILVGIERIVPRKWNLFLNKVYINLATKGKGKRKEPQPEKDEKLEYAASFFSKERAYYESLFEKNKIITGTGKAI